MSERDTERSIQRHVDRANRYVAGLDAGDAVALAQYELAFAQLEVSLLIARRLAAIEAHLQRAGTKGW